MKGWHSLREGLLESEFNETNHGLSTKQSVGTGGRSGT